MQNSVDCFYAAVAALAGDGHIKQRLISAFQDNLEPLDADDLPGALREQFSGLKDRLHSVDPANGEGSVCATVRKMSVDEASRCAQSVVKLYAELNRLGAVLEDSVPPLENEAGDDAEHHAPPFLIKTAGQAG